MIFIINDCFTSGYSLSLSLSIPIFSLPFPHTPKQMYNSHQEIHARDRTSKEEGDHMNKAIFLDRDGVINEVLSKRVKFVNTPDDFYLLEGVGESIRQLNEAGYLVFVVTNQGGVGLGYMSEEELGLIHEKMKDDLADYSAMINDIAYCPHKPHADCACRKPNPQMIADLTSKHRVNLKKSYMVGDRAPDIEAGERAGVTTVLVGDRKETSHPDLTFPNLLSFSNWLIGE